MFVNANFIPKIYRALEINRKNEYINGFLMFSQLFYIEKKRKLCYVLVIIVYNNSIACYWVFLLKMPLYKCILYNYFDQNILKCILNYKHERVLMAIFYYYYD